MIIDIPEGTIDPNEARYYEQAVLPTKTRGKIRQLKERESNFDIDLFGKEVVNGYHSVYNLSHEVTKHVEATGSIGNYCGAASADFLHWDMDCDGNVEKAYEDTEALLDRLDSMGASLDSVTVCLSGGKGFHVLYRTDDIKRLGQRKNLPNIVKHICSKIAEGLESFDESVYDKTRLIRALNSKHKKTGLYKIPLSVMDFRRMSVVEIEELAKEQVEGWETEADSDVEFIFEVLEEKQKEKEKKFERRFGATNLIDGLKNGISAGDTNNFLTSYAGIYHRRGMDDEFIKWQLMAINNSCCERPIEESEINTIVRSVSKYAVDDKYREVESSEITTMKQNVDAYVRIAETMVDIKTCYPHIDEMFSQFLPGHVMLIIARPGIGKTNAGIKYANELARVIDDMALFISLEMGRSAVGFRAAQSVYSTKIEGELHNKEVRHQLINNEEFRGEVSNAWSNFLTVDKSLRSIEAIKKYYHKACELTDKKITIIVIDYMQLMSGSGDRADLDLIARGLKNLGKELNVRVIALAQVNRGVGSENTKPELVNIKEMGSLEDACDICISMWKDKAEVGRLHNEVTKGREFPVGYQWDILQRGMAYKTVDFFEAQPVTKDNSDWGR